MRGQAGGRFWSKKLRLEAASAAADETVGVRESMVSASPGATTLALVIVTMASTAIVIEFIAARLQGWVVHLLYLAGAVVVISVCRGGRRTRVVALWACGLLADVELAAFCGKCYIFFRCLYPVVFRKGMPWLLLSTVPCYNLIWYMLWRAVVACA